MFHVLSTGGTIASTGEEGATPELDASDLLAGLDVDARAESFATVPSPHLTFDLLADLRARVEDLVADGSEGVVVTVGTDTLEEVAAFLGDTYAGDPPVVVTGAMRTADAPGADGPANLRAALSTAADPGAAGRGVLVTFADRVLPAGEARKVHATRPDAFRAPEFGPLGVVREGGVDWRRERDRGPTFDPDPDALTADVPVVHATLDAPAGRVPTPDDPPAAVVLATTGAGHVPPALLDPLADLRDAGVPVVATTRCPEGRLLAETYGFEGSERSLRDLGCLVADLPPAAARVRTVVALAADRVDDAFPTL
ncbi:MAG: asparaginase [Haloferacaceae archaeon]